MTDIYLKFQVFGIKMGLSVFLGPPRSIPVQFSCLSAKLRLGRKKEKIMTKTIM